MPSPAEAAVQRQLEVPGVVGLERFLAEFSPQVRVHRPPATAPALEGIDALRAFYANERFNRPALHAELLGRMVLGNKVVDHERISGVREAPFEMVVVYQVVEGRIATLWTFDGA